MLSTVFSPDEGRGCFFSLSTSMSFVAANSKPAFIISASHTDITHFAARIFLCIGCGQAHELVMSTDLLHCAPIQMNRFGEKNLQYDITGMAVQRLLLRPFRSDVCQERIGGQVQHWQAGTTESVSLRAHGRQNQHHIVVSCVHAVEVCKVQADVGVQQLSRWDLES